MSSVEDGHSYSKFVFISEKDKGLDKSLSEFSPRNHATNCVHHIKQNVKTWFGPKAAEMVFPIANALSMMQEETLLEQLKMKSASTYDNLEKIPMEQWHNRHWITTWNLPPQHQQPLWNGVMTSNMSECINSMIDEYRSEGWTDLLEGIL